MKTRETVMVELSRLDHGDLIGIDSRSGEPPPDQAATERLAADILSRGLLQPLGVYDNGAGLFVAYGNRRLDAMQHLAKTGAIPKDQMIPVIMLEGTPADALAASISENDNREDLHPVAQFENLARLLTMGWGVKQLGKAFGLSPQKVQQTLALGGLHVSVREAWRAGKISEEAAKAFTMAPLADQAAALDRVLKDNPYGRPNAAAVRDALFGDQRSAPGLLKYVGDEAYAEAGGALVADLFSKSQAVGDIDLLQRLANEKLSAKVEALKAEGWGQVHTVQPPGWFGYERVGEIVLTPAEAKAVEAAKADRDTTRGWLEKNRIETEARLRGLDAATKATCHVLIAVTSDGLEQVQAGFRPRGAVAEPAQDADDSHVPKAATAYAYEAQTLALSMLVDNPSLTALRLCVAALIGALPKASPIQISVNGWNPPRPDDVPGDYCVNKTGEAYFPPIATWFAICQAEQPDLMRWLSTAMSMTIDATAPIRAAGLTDSMVSSMLEDLGISRLEYASATMMSFDLKAYLAMLKKGQIADIVREVGAGDIAEKIPGMKKAQAESTAYEAIKGKGWLPPQIRLEKE